jgi:hypothetical protein
VNHGKYVVEIGEAIVNEEEEITVAILLSVYIEEIVVDSLDH